ncbi:hypothetical protein Tco_0313433 [Tanacetum coccineum]
MGCGMGGAASPNGLEVASGHDLINEYDKFLQEDEATLLESVDSRELKITGGGMHGNLEETRMGAEWTEEDSKACCLYEYKENVTEIENQPLYDRFVTAEGMHAVPPPMTGNYMPSGPDVEIDDSKEFPEKVVKSAQRLTFVLPIWPSYSSTITPVLTTDDKREGPREEEQNFLLEDIYQNSTDGIFTTSSYDDEGAVADFINLETVVNVSPIPTSRIHSSHPSALILGDPTSAVQTRSKVNKSSRAHAFVSYVQKAKEKLT